MDRRGFLSLFGVGAVGGLAGAGAARSKGTGRRGRPHRRPGPPEDKIETATASGMHRVVWSVDTDEPAAALTFDDGPDPAFTPRVLDVLDRFDVRATFLVMGYNAVRHTDLLRRIVDSGHEVGAHGWTHVNLLEASVGRTETEIDYGIKMVEEEIEAPIRFFRPPYGRFDQAAVRALARSHRDLVVWSITRGKLNWKEPDRIADHVVGSLGPGEIVNFHDGIGRGTFNRRGAHAAKLARRREDEVLALPRILKGALAKGIRLETLSDLMKAR